MIYTLEHIYILYTYIYVHIHIIYIILLFIQSRNTIHPKTLASMKEWSNTKGVGDSSSICHLNQQREVSKFGYEQMQKEFISQLQVYTGKQDGTPKHGIDGRVVKDLTRSLVGKGYHIFCDNSFISVTLAEVLLMDDLYLCGTTRYNRKDFPSALKSKQVLKKLRRGQSIFQQKNLVAAIWKDKKPVAFISTQCNATGEETVQTKQKDGSIISSCTTHGTIV